MYNLEISKHHFMVGNTLSSKEGSSYVVVHRPFMDYWRESNRRKKVFVV
jgi:hypothetical protein